ncbi:MAG: V-type ATP synthase subunit F [Paracoccaceae bacterium]
MQETLFIGDEVTAAAFRLAGVETRVAAPDEAAQVLAAELARRRVILLTNELARALPRAMMDRVLQSVEPVVTILPDLRGRAGALDLEARVRRELGIEGNG